MTLYIDKTGTLGGHGCTTIRMEPDVFHGITPETAAGQIDALLDEHPVATHDDLGDATVIFIGETHEAMWIVPLVVSRVVSEVHAMAVRGGTNSQRSVWVSSDEVRSGTAICVHPGGPYIAGTRVPFKVVDDGGDET